MSIRARVEGSAFARAGAASAEGAVSAASGGSASDRCAAFENNSAYLKSVSGGRRQLLILPGAGAMEDLLREWFDSILELPSATQLNKVEHIDFVVPELTPAVVDSYVGRSQPAEVELEESGVSGCAVPAACLSGTRKNAYASGAAGLFGLSVSAFVVLV